MKKCPSCQGNVSDTAKFCVKCGCNIKKYEEEHAQVYFCPECGTKFSGGVFCPECGFDVSNELNGQAVPSESDTFGDGWLENIESITGAAVDRAHATDAQWQSKQALSAFEYEEHADGTYTITGLKDKTALQYTIPQGVVAIADNAFENCNAIKITLPDGVLRIGACAFKGCQDLSNLNLPKSLMIVGDEAFAQCEMLDIELPASIRKIGKDAIKNTVQDKKRAAAEEEEARRAELAKWEVGCTPTFGSYAEDDSGSESPIEWLVLERNGSRALLISKYLLDCKKYNTEKVSTTWKTSGLRNWLNHDFLKAAFTDAEQQKIQSTAISTPDNWLYGTDGGDPTTDKIFVLSIEEAQRYFSSDDERKCAPTAYAVFNGAYKEDDTGCGCCWLRSTGEDQCLAASVSTDGSLDESGVCVDNTYDCVRPAMWVDISELIK